MNATTILKNAVVENHPSGTVLDIFETDRVLYKDVEFRGITLIIRDNAKNALHGCLLRDCEVIAPNECKHYWLSGCNTMLGGTFNGKEIEDLRTR